MNKPLTRYCAAAFCAIAVSATSCIDDDYDLSEDIDLTVNVGGQLITLPGSSTQDITLAQIFDLDNNSSIKKVETDGQYGLSLGDYVIEQAGSSEPSDFIINKVTITTHPSNTASTTLPEFVNLGAGQRVTEQASPTINAINLSDDNVDLQLVRLDKAKMAVDIEFSVAYTSSTGFNGTAYIDRGYTAAFDPSWKIEIVDPATLDFLRLTGDNTVEFTRDVAVTRTSPMTARVRLVEIDFANVASGQGLYAPGHFRLNSSVQSSGTISLYFDASQPVGARENLTLVTTTSVRNALITEVTGVVNPDINVDNTSFTITDIPDFLSDKENKLVLDNPRINFVVTNNSPLTLDVKGYLSSYLEGVQTAEIKLGHFADNTGTAAITVPAQSVTKFILSRRPVQEAGAVNIIVDNLNDIIETVPDEILFHGVECKAAQTPVTFVLGDEYTFDASYDAIIPLAFGRDMKLHYTHEDTGWDEDLEDYNFDRVQITLTAINTIPLDMTPSATALGKDGRPMSTIDVQVTGSVAPGTVASPATADLKIELKSTGTSIKDLDGIALVFDASSNAEVEGINLNAGQAVRFENIKVTILGGITINLNDKD
ncbi:MAG: hypothetical protein NC418_05000 [Muribaculaceae bacterium]|nr:hypothetical protein [Muribaculaceae bacterium]